jgi:hypothetical protein
MNVIAMQDGEQAGFKVRQATALDRAKEVGV